MIRAQYDERGPEPQEFIRPVELPTPEPGPGEVLLEVLAAPINPSDVLTLTGEYGLLPPLPAVGGNEGVGRVVAQGPGVTTPAVGDTVLLPAGSGTWSSHLVTAAAPLVPLAGEADPLQLSMITVNPPTAALLLSEFVDLQPGDWVAQNAANSAVGGYLVQLAKLRGLKTVNLVRREEARAAVLEDGAEVALVDGDELPERVQEATGGADIRLGIDAVGGKATGRLADCLGEGATLVNYGVLSGEACVVSPRSFVFRDVTLRGFWLAKWFRLAPRERQQAVYGEIIRRVARGELHARIHATYGLQQIREAVGEAAEGGRDGKVLVVPER